MRGSYLGKWDLTAFTEVWRQKVVIRTDPTEYTAEYCRELTGVGETRADCVRTGEPTANRTAALARSPQSATAPRIRTSPQRTDLQSARVPRRCRASAT